MSTDKTAENGPPEGKVRRSTLVVTNLIKLGGFLLAVHEILTRRDPIVMGVCVVMMSGVQGLEETLIAFFERFFGVPPRS